MKSGAKSQAEVLIRTRPKPLVVKTPLAKAGNMRHGFDPWGQEDLMA